MSMCAYGMPYSKDTSIFHCNFAVLAGELRCRPGNHTHLVLQGSLTTAAAASPQQFCEQYAQCAARQCKHFREMELEEMEQHAAAASVGEQSAPT
eukprot:2295013-Alexandrium_andersonii.AAC.1